MTMNEDVAYAAHTQPTTTESLEITHDFADYPDPMYRALRKAIRATKSEISGILEMQAKHPTIGTELNARRLERLIDEETVLLQSLTIRSVTMHRKEG